MIRPRLEFCIQSWSPRLSNDVETLERVQSTATRLVPQLRKFSYEERLPVLSGSNTNFRDGSTGIRSPKPTLVKFRAVFVDLLNRIHVDDANAGCTDRWL